MSATLSENDFETLASQGFNRIPVSRVLLADTETPLSAYHKLASGPQSYLFESVQGGERWGRYSIIGLPALNWLTVSGCTVLRYVNGQLTESFDAPDPLAAVDQILSACHSAPMTHLPMFHGVWVGYFGYDMVRYVEPRLAESCPRDELGVPDIWLVLSEEVVIFDNLAGALTLVVNADTQTESAYARAVSRLDALEAALSQPISSLEPISLAPRDAAAVEEKVTFSTDEATYKDWVSRVREYIL